MAHVAFFEKPGCAGNAKQRSLLQAAGHTLERHDLLTHPWTTEQLRAFLDALPVVHWFNRSAPRVKRGEVVPERLGPDEALALLIREPLLIRRPLMQRADGATLVGFELSQVEAFLGPLPEADGAPKPRSLEGCAAAASRGPSSEH